MSWTDTADHPYREGPLNVDYCADCGTSRYDHTGIIHGPAIQRPAETEPNLVAWIREQLDEDERVARAATPGPWRWVDPGGRTKQALVAEGYPWRMVVSSATGDVYPSVADAEHIARHDPARVLREVEAKRLIISEYERYAAERRRAMNGWETSREVSPILTALALPYSDRPGYREEWRP